MTILTDIFSVVSSAEKKPIGLLLGISGQHAYAADAHYVDREGTPEQKRDLQIIRALSRSHTADFDGWDLILDDRPNPHRPNDSSKRIAA